MNALYKPNVIMLAMWCDHMTTVCIFFKPYSRYACIDATLVVYVCHLVTLHKQVCADHIEQSDHIANKNTCIYS